MSIRTVSADVASCSAHEYHAPRLHLLASHHVVPLSWGGPNTAANRVVLCPSGHVNTHWLLDGYVKAKGVPSWDFRQHFGPGERHLAERAWSAYLADPKRYHPVLTS